MSQRIGLAVSCALLAIASLRAQTEATLEFEVASVKASASTEATWTGRGGPGSNSPGRITFLNVNMRILVTTAWGLKDYQLTGPATMDTARYDVVAKMPAGTTVENFRLMLQHLLAERIGLMVHHEPKEMSVYEMVVAKGGLKIKEAEKAPEDGTPPPTGHTDKDGFMILPPGRKGAVMSRADGVTRCSARMQTVADVVSMMERFSGRSVIDKSSLTGKYDYKLAFAPTRRRRRTAWGALLPSRRAAGRCPARTCHSSQWPATRRLSSLMPSSNNWG
jgi:uncharacterized protein (TIGR03435 family)